MESVYDIFYKKCNIDDIDGEAKRIICEAKLKEFIEQLMDLEKDSVSFLTEKQTYVLRKKYGLLDNGVQQSQNQIALGMGISRQAVSQYIGNSLDKLNTNIRLIRESDIKLAKLSKDKMFQIPIEILNLPYKVICALNTKGIYNMGQLSELYLLDLYDIKGLGNKKRELIQKTHDCGVYFKDEEMLMAVENEKDLKIKYKKTLDLPIEALGFSRGVYNALKNAGINCVGDLVSLSNLELMRKKNIGVSTCSEVGRLLGKYGLMLGDDKNSDTSLEEVIVKDSNPQEKCLIPIEKLNLSLRVYNALKRAGINFVQDLTKSDPVSLYGFRWLGDKGVLEVITKVKELGLKFKSSDSIETVIDEVKKRKEISFSRYLSLSKEQERLSQKDEILTIKIKQMLRSNISKEENNITQVPIKRKDK